MKKIFICLIIISFSGCGVANKINEIVESMPDVSSLTSALEEAFNTECMVGYYEINNHLNLQIYIQAPNEDLTFGELKTTLVKLIESESDIKYSTLSIIIGDPILEDDW